MHSHLQDIFNNSSPIIGVICNPIGNFPQNMTMFSRKASQLNLGIMNAKQSTWYLAKKQETDTKSMGAQVSQTCSVFAIFTMVQLCAY